MDLVRRVLGQDDEGMYYARVPATYRVESLLHSGESIPMFLLKQEENGVTLEGLMEQESMEFRNITNYYSH